MLVLFLFNTFLSPVHGQDIGRLFLNTFQENQCPLFLKGVGFDYADPLKFEFIFDTGATRFSRADELKGQTKELIEYFLLGLTVPEKELWVNLSYYEQGRILPESINKTIIGKNFLSQDYLLKKLTSALTIPDGKEGERFWKVIYKKLHELYGTTILPVDILNKVWIVPNEAEVVQYKNKVFVTKATLKVMMEEDSRALQKTKDDGRPLATLSGLARTMDGSPAGRLSYGRENIRRNDKEKKVIPQEQREEINKVSVQVMKEQILPLIEKEINTSKEFAPLRQLYSSLIISAAFKKRLKQSIHYVFVNQNKTSPLKRADAQVKEEIYQQYIDLYKKGVFNYVRKDYDPYERKTIKRRYVSGGLLFDGLEQKIYERVTENMTAASGVIGRPVGKLLKERATLSAVTEGERGTMDERTTNRTGSDEGREKQASSTVEKKANDGNAGVATIVGKALQQYPEFKSNEYKEMLADFIRLTTPEKFNEAMEEHGLDLRYPLRSIFSNWQYYRALKEFVQAISPEVFGRAFVKDPGLIDDFLREIFSQKQQREYNIFIAHIYPEDFADALARNPADVLLALKHFKAWGTDGKTYYSTIINEMSVERFSGAFLGNPLRAVDQLESAAYSYDKRDWDAYNRILLETFGFSREDRSIKSLERRLPPDNLNYSHFEKILERLRMFARRNPETAQKIVRMKDFKLWIVGGVANPWMNKGLRKDVDVFFDISAAVGSDENVALRVLNSYFDPVGQGYRVEGWFGGIIFQPALDITAKAKEILLSDLKDTQSSSGEGQHSPRGPAVLTSQMDGKHAAVGPRNFPDAAIQRIKDVEEQLRAGKEDILKDIQKGLSPGVILLSDEGFTRVFELEAYPGVVFKIFSDPEVYQARLKTFEQLSAHFKEQGVLEEQEKVGAFTLRELPYFVPTLFKDGVVVEQEGVLLDSLSDDEYDRQYGTYKNAVEVLKEALHKHGILWDDAQVQNIARIGTRYVITDIENLVFQNPGEEKASSSVIDAHRMEQLSKSLRNYSDDAEVKNAVAELEKIGGVAGVAALIDGFAYASANIRKEIIAALARSGSVNAYTFIEHGLLDIDDESGNWFMVHTAVPALVQADTQLAKQLLRKTIVQHPTIQVKEYVLKEMLRQEPFYIPQRVLSAEDAEAYLFGEKDRSVVTKEKIKSLFSGKEQTAIIDTFFENPLEEVLLFKDNFEDLLKQIKETSIREALERLWASSFNSAKFLKYSTLLRKIYDYSISANDSRSPLRYAIDNNIFIHLGGNLYLSPITESFRRHVIFSLTDKRINFSFDALMPGELSHKRDIGAFERQTVAEDILRHTPAGKTYSVEPMKVRDLRRSSVAGVYEAYGQDIKDQDEYSLKIITFKNRDGKRLENLNKQIIAEYSRQLRMPQEAVEDAIFEQVVEIADFIHQRGYIGGLDYHIGNFEVVLDPAAAADSDKILVVLVGDFVDFTKSRMSKDKKEELEAKDWAALLQRFSYFMGREITWEEVQAILEKKKMPAADLLSTGLIDGRVSNENLSIIDLYRKEANEDIRNNYLGLKSTGPFFQMVHLYKKDELALTTDSPNILIIGGNAEEVALLWALYPRATISIVNLHLPYLRQIKEEYEKQPGVGSRLHLYRADASVLDQDIFPNASFDVIFAHGVDESTYFGDALKVKMLEGIVREERRLIRPGGYIYHIGLDKKYYQEALAKGELQEVFTNRSGYVYFLRASKTKSSSAIQERPQTIDLSLQTEQTDKSSSSIETTQDRLKEEVSEKFGIKKEVIDQVFAGPMHILDEKGIVIGAIEPETTKPFDSFAYALGYMDRKIGDGVSYEDYGYKKARTIDPSTTLRIPPTGLHFEEGKLKIAVFVDSSHRQTLALRQTFDGMWETKLDDAYIIRIKDPHALEGELFGTFIAVYEKDSLRVLTERFINENNARIVVDPNVDVNSSTQLIAPGSDIVISQHEGATGTYWTNENIYYRLFLDLKQKAGIDRLDEETLRRIGISAPEVVRTREGKIVLIDHNRVVGAHKAGLPIAARIRTVSEDAKIGAQALQTKILPSTNDEVGKNTLIETRTLRISRVRQALGRTGVQEYTRYKDFMAVPQQYATRLQYLIRELALAEKTDMEKAKKIFGIVEEEMQDARSQIQDGEKQASSAIQESVYIDQQLTARGEQELNANQGQASSAVETERRLQWDDVINQSLDLTLESFADPTHRGPNADKLLRFTDGVFDLINKLPLIRPSARQYQILWSRLHEEIPRFTPERLLVDYNRSYFVGKTGIYMRLDHVLRELIVNAYDALILPGNGDPNTVVIPQDHIHRAKLLFNKESIDGEGYLVITIEDDGLGNKAASTEVKKAKKGTREYIGGRGVGLRVVNAMVSLAGGTFMLNKADRSEGYFPDQKTVAVLKIPMARISNAYLSDERKPLQAKIELSDEEIKTMHEVFLTTFEEFASLSASSAVQDGESQLIKLTDGQRAIVSRAIDPLILQFGRLREEIDKKIAAGDYGNALDKTTEFLKDIYGKNHDFHGIFDLLSGQAQRIFIDIVGDRTGNILFSLVSALGMKNPKAIGEAENEFSGWIEKLRALRDTESILYFRKNPFATRFYLSDGRVLLWKGRISSTIFVTHELRAYLGEAVSEIEKVLHNTLAGLEKSFTRKDYKKMQALIGTLSDRIISSKTQENIQRFPTEFKDSFTRMVTDVIRGHQATFDKALQVLQKEDIGESQKNEFKARLRKNIEEIKRVTMLLGVLKHSQYIELFKEDIYFHDDKGSLVTWDDLRTLYEDDDEEYSSSPLEAKKGGVDLSSIGTIVTLPELEAQGCYETRIAPFLSQIGDLNTFGGYRISIDFIEIVDLKGALAT